MAEFPKFLHKDWKPTHKQGEGHQEAGQSKLVQSAEEAELLVAEGWTDAPPALESAPAEHAPKKTKPTK